MKSRTLPVKRKPVSKGVFRRLSAVTRSRKQRVAAAATPTELEAEDAGSKVSRALVIIFMIHVVAIVLIFVHQKFLDGRTPERSAETAAPVAAPAPPRENLPRLANGGRAYVVKTGDNYARIAAAEGVDEAELRAFNNNVDIEPKLLLNIPPKRIVAEEPPEVVSIRENVPSDVDRGLVEVVPVDVTSAPKAQLVRPAAAGTQPAAVSSGRSYVVKPGDSIWRISQNFSVDQNALMKLNGIEDARKMKVGMTLRIP